MGEVDDDELFAEFQRNPRRSVRNKIVERHLGLAVHIARRFSPSTIGDEDLQQVAMLALVKAVDRFDPTIGSAFSAFAGRTIEGEIKRHFRDKTWSVRVPRSAKELHLAVRRANDELTQALGRSPSVPEVAEHLGIEPRRRHHRPLGRRRAKRRVDRRLDDRRRHGDRPARGHCRCRDRVRADRRRTRRRDAAGEVARTRTGDRASSVLRGPVAGRDRGTLRDLPDARVAPLASIVRPDATQPRRRVEPSRGAVVARRRRVAADDVAFCYRVRRLPRRRWG